MTRTPRGHPFPWTVLSRRIVDGGPVYDRYTLAESAGNEANALKYAEVRAKQGYWVEVFREHHYFVPETKS